MSSETPPPPPQPENWPFFGQKAKIVGGTALYRRLPTGTTIEALADAARCHPNTVRTALDGRRVQYVKAHGVFTALNVVARNAFPRVEHVLYFDDADQPQTDPSLAGCRVLHRAADLLRQHNLKPETIATRAGISYLDASVVLNSGKPAPLNIVTAVLRVFQRVDPALTDENEIIA